MVLRERRLKRNLGDNKKHGSCLMLRGMFGVRWEEEIKDDS